jgi:hypothetical protein
MTNIHPYQRAHEAKEYMTLDMDTLNPYNYKNMANQLNPYQKQQDMYYFTRQLNPISLVNLGPQWMNPSYFSSDNRSTIYESVNLNNQERNNQYQTPQNNSNLWRDNKGHYTQQMIRPISAIQAGKATSFQEFHGMQLY